MRTYVKRELQSDFATATPIDWSSVGDGSAHLLQPTREQLLRSSSPLMRVRTAWAVSWGSWSRFLSIIEPSYRPVHFFNADGVPIGAAAKDLVRLANFGAHWLFALGVTSADTVALLEGADSAIEPWQLSGGTRRAGVPLAVVEDPTHASASRVSVIAGRPKAVLSALQGGTWPELRLVVVFGRHAGRVDERVAKLGAGSDVAVRRAWAVPGARSVWFECAGGPDTGWHTNAAAEVVEVGDDDEIVWTGLGWAGTVFLRLRTDLRVASVDKTTCPGCGTDSPRLFLADGSPALARFLRDDSRVADFRLTDGGADVLPVRAGANARLVGDARAAFPHHAITVKSKRGWLA